MYAKKGQRRSHLPVMLACVMLALLLGGCGQMRLAVSDSSGGVTRLSPGTGTGRPVIPETTSTPPPPLAGATAIVRSRATGTATATVTTGRQTATPATATASATVAQATPSPSATGILVPATSSPGRSQVPTAPPGPQIHSFGAEPATITPGGSVNLSWEASANRVELCLQVPFQGSLVTRNCEQVADAGTRAYPLDPVYRNQVLLLLRASRNGASVERTVTVELPCPDDWWFFANPPEGCPAHEPQRQQAAAQQFQRGTMIWLSESGVYYILYDEPGQPYETVYDPLERTGSGGVNPGEPPPGLQAPVSGFGLLWRGQISGLETGLFGRLGWALAPEFGYDAVMQSEVADRYARTFLRGPEGQVLVLQPSFYTWSVWEGAR